MLIALTPYYHLNHYHIGRTGSHPSCQTTEAWLADFGWCADSRSPLSSDNWSVTDFGWCVDSKSPLLLDNWNMTDFGWCVDSKSPLLSDNWSMTDFGSTSVSHPCCQTTEAWLSDVCWCVDRSSPTWCRQCWTSCSGSFPHWQTTTRTPPPWGAPPVPRRPWLTFTCRPKRLKSLPTSSWYEWRVTGSYGDGDSSVVRTPDLWLKGPGFKSLQGRWENFLLQGQLSVLTLISVSFPPPFYRSSTFKIPVILPKVQVAGYS